VKKERKINIGIPGEIVNQNEKVTSKDARPDQYEISFSRNICKYFLQRLASCNTCVTLYECMTVNSLKFT